LHPVLASISHASAVDPTSSHSISHDSSSKELFFLDTTYFSILWLCLVMSKSVQCISPYDQSIVFW
jgi:hypothetical protein